MRVPTTLTQYADVATVAQLHALQAMDRRLKSLSANKLVVEYLETTAAREALRQELDARLEALAAATKDVRDE